MSSEVRDPYKIFFPLGVFAGTVGVLFWFLFEARYIEFYPRESHGNLMFFGMLWPFVIGFLMTAIPRMTSTPGPTYLEVALAILLAFCQLVFNFRNLVFASVVLFGLQALVLLAFIVRRFWISRRIPFPGFIFLPLAFVQAEAGVWLFAFSLVSRETALLLAGEAFLMNLTLGLGSRLIPMISRMPAARPPSETQTGETWVKPVAVALVLNLGYVLEALGFATAGRALRLIAILAACFLLLDLHRRPQQWSVSGVGFKVALLFVLTGQTVVLFGGGLPAQHLVYIGGFGLITLLVSTRVVLAHGGADLSYEIGSRRLGAMVACVSMAALLRWWAGYGFNGVFSFAAIIVFCVGLALWTLRFVTTRGPSRDCR